jgi:hypothetical protein
LASLQAPSLGAQKQDPGKWLKGANLVGQEKGPWDEVRDCLKLSARNGLAHGRSKNEFVGEAAYWFLDAEKWVDGT